MFATHVHFNSQRRVGEVCCGHVGRKTSKVGGDHDSKYKVTELTIVVSYFCCMSKKRKLLCSKHSFFPSASCLLFFSMAPSWLSLTNHYRNVSPSHEIHMGYCSKGRLVHSLFSLLLLCMSKILFASIRALSAKVVSIMLLDGDRWDKEYDIKINKS